MAEPATSAFSLADVMRPVKSLQSLSSTGSRSVPPNAPAVAPQYSLAAMRSMEVDPELLQGASMSQCLAGWGVRWASPSQSLHELQGCHGTLCRQAALSKPTDYYDVFLSHDWGTSRWMKFLSLLICFNGKAAAVATVLVGMLSGALRGAEIVPNNAWPAMIGHLTFIIFICFWQRIREVFKTPHIVFLDKLCISQEDQILKEKGILGLAAFLSRAETLLVLWSPRYFRRLWCTYELATFLNLASKSTRPRKIQVMPVDMSRLLLLMWVSWQALMVSWEIAIISAGGDEYYANVLLLAILSAVALVLLPMYNYYGLKLMRDLQELPNQLESFRLQEAQCACCSENHRNSAGEPIPCDRELVFETLRNWYTSAEDHPQEDIEEHLEVFNNMVRERLPNSVLHSMGGNVLPVRFYIGIAICCNAPYLSDLGYRLAQGPEDSAEFTSLQYAIWVLRVCMASMNLYLGMLLLMRSSVAMWNRGARIFPCTGQVAKSFLLVPPIFFLGFAILMPFRLAYFARGSLLPAVPLGCIVLLNVYAFCSVSRSSWRIPLQPAGNHTFSSPLPQFLSAEPCCSTLDEPAAVHSLSEASNDDAHSTFSI